MQVVAVVLQLLAHQQAETVEAVAVHQLTTHHFQLQ
jgi:hypothetical protein